MATDGNPLLLIDNSTMYVIGKGTYKVESMSFAEAKAIIDTLDVDMDAVLDALADALFEAAEDIEVTAQESAEAPEAEAPRTEEPKAGEPAPEAPSED